MPNPVVTPKSWLTMTLSDIFGVLSLERIMVEEARHTGFDPARPREERQTGHDVAWAKPQISV